MSMLNMKCNNLKFTVSLLLFALILGINPVSAQDPRRLDLTIQDAVEDEFAFDDAVPITTIDVLVEDGVVRLSGRVHNILAKERAERLAETVRGVISVINLIEVAPFRKVSDRNLKNRINDALSTATPVAPYEIEVDADEGTVTLMGSLSSWQEKQAVATVVKGVQGVVQVKNDITVDYEKPRLDSEIQEDVRAALRWDVLIDHARINLDVGNGTVEISGMVGSAAEKRRAIFKAWVNGVEMVDATELQVAQSARDTDTRENESAVSEDDIKRALDSVFEKDPRVKDYNVASEVNEGRVTLRGNVESLEAKRSAGQVARSTVGVKDVVNRLKIRGDHLPPDNFVARQVEEAIERDPYLSGAEVNVQVRSGVVRLSGNVDSVFEKARADDIAAAVRGVQMVRNHLEPDQVDTPLPYEPYLEDKYPLDYEWYRYDPGMSRKEDSELREDIKGQLIWSPYVNPKDMDIQVDNGRVTLTGTVQSSTAKRAAGQDALKAGAASVDNQLTIE